jgi:hypothetical protein
MKFMVFGFGRRKDNRFYRKDRRKMNIGSLEGLSSLKANKEAVEKFKAEQIRKKQEELKEMGFSNVNISETRNRTPEKLERLKKIKSDLEKAGITKENGYTNFQLSRMLIDDNYRRNILLRESSKGITEEKKREDLVKGAGNLRYNLRGQAMRGGATPTPQQKTQTMKQSVSGAVDPTARKMAERNKENVNWRTFNQSKHFPQDENVIGYGEDYKQLAKEYNKLIENDLKQSKKLYELKASGVKEVGSGNVDQLIELNEEELDRRWKMYEPLFKTAREKYERKLENEAEEKEEAEANKPQSSFNEDLREKQQESVRKQGVATGRKLPDILTKATSKLEWIEKFKESSLPSVKPEIVSVGDDTPIKMIKFVIDPNDPDYIPVNPMTIGKNVPQWDLDGNPIRNKKRDGSLPKNQSVYSEGKSGQALPFDMNDIAILSERLGIQPKNWNLSDLSRNQIGSLKNIMLWKLGKITEQQTGVM